MDMYSSVVWPQMWLVSVTVFLFCYNYFVKESWKGLPPGPLTLPLIGSLPFLGLDIREPLRKMAAKYGDVYTIYLGSRRVVVLNGYDVIKEAFVKNGNVFSGRAPVFFVTSVTEGYGIVSSQGPFWREQRRHALHVLRDFGLGRTILEDKIIEEVEFFIDELRHNVNKPFYPQQTIQKSVANVIASVTFGKRMEYDDPIFIEYLKIMNGAFEILGNSGVITTFPFLRHLPGDWFKVKQLKRNVDYMNLEYGRMIEEHKLTAIGEDEPTDFINAYLKKMKEEKDNKATSFSERQLQGMIGDLFGVGTETTTTTLTWAILYMSLNEHIQNRCQEELDMIVGSGSVPRMHHRTSLPYTEACILEIQRLGDIVPLGVPHAVTEDVQFRGYFIPSGTMILANMYGLHRDPHLWIDPETFNPGRFLNDDGNVVRKEEMIPFSIGRRLCLGEGLARMELFLYFTSMMLQYHFTVVPGYPLPNTCGQLAITNIPKPFHIMMEVRNEN